jgi:hypothetical protein
LNAFWEIRICYDPVQDGDAQRIGGRP